MEYLQIQFTNITVEQSDILLAQLAEIGFDGFEENQSELKAFIPTNIFDENLFSDIISSKISYSKTIIKKENWNSIWETSFQPIAIDNPKSNKPFVYLRAAFHLPNIAYEYDIIVTPKMSFGTGHHATTFMMIQQMSRLYFKNKTIIDFGTGTGVLAILAEKLGANNITAIDCDEWSVENAKENLRENSCNKTNIVLATTIPAQQKADIVLANINLNIITENIQAIKNNCDTEATILFSGIMLHDKENCIRLIEKQKIIINDVVEKDGWLAFVCKNS